MTFRRRSWVIGRGVGTFSICSAMAFASKIPTQIGSTRCPSLSRRMTMGMFVIGSTIRPLMVISICITTTYLCAHARLSPHAMGPCPLDADCHSAANPFGRPWQVHDHIRARTPGQLGLAPAAGGIDEHVDRLPHEPRVERGLNLAL